MILLTRISIATTVVLLMVGAMSGYGQEYIVFRKQKGFDSTIVSGNIKMFRNHVESKSQDTIMEIFNFYYTSAGRRITMLLPFEKEDPNFKLTVLPGDLLVSAVIPHGSGEVMPMKKLTKAEVEKMKVLTDIQVLETFYKSTKFTVENRKSGMPSNRTTKYKLIIEKDKDYFLVDKPVLFVSYFLADNFWYFPDEFKAGVLNVTRKYKKNYSRSDFEKMATELPFERQVLDKVVDRVYTSKEESSIPFQLYTYTFWEYLGDGGIMMANNKVFPNYHPGLGTFTVLPKVGIINCSLKPSTTERKMPTELSEQVVTSINDVSPEQFGQLLKKHIYDKNIWGGE